MLINTDSIMSMAEANRGSSLFRKVDEEGTVVIMKHNRPSYITMPFGYMEFFSLAEKVAEKQGTVAGLEHRIGLVEDGTIRQERAIAGAGAWRQKRDKAQEELKELEAELHACLKRLKGYNDTDNVDEDALNEMEF